VQASFRARDLLLASWETDAAAVRRSLPPRIEPADVDGRFLVSLVAFRVEHARVGRVAALPYTQVNVRTYVRWEDEAAVFFLAARVSAFGLPGVLLGAPFRHARLRVRGGLVRASGLGISLSYGVGGRDDAGPLGRHELGLFESDGLRAFRVRRGEASWHRADLTEPARAEFLVALGFELADEPELLFTERTSFEAEVPPRPLE
jgi:hypothetical protein